MQKRLYSKKGLVVKTVASSSLSAPKLAVNPKAKSRKENGRRDGIS